MAGINRGLSTFAHNLKSLRSTVQLLFKGPVEVRRTRNRRLRSELQLLPVSTDKIFRTCRDHSEVTARRCGVTSKGSANVRQKHRSTTESAQHQKLAEVLRRRSSSCDEALQTHPGLRLLLPDDESNIALRSGKSTKAPEGAATGATTGGVVFGAIGPRRYRSTCNPRSGPPLQPALLRQPHTELEPVVAFGGIVGALIGVGMPVEYELSCHTKGAGQGRRTRALSVHCRYFQAVSTPLNKRSRRQGRRISHLPAKLTHSAKAASE